MRAQTREPQMAADEPQMSADEKRNGIVRGFVKRWHEMLTSPLRSSAAHLRPSAFHGFFTSLAALLFVFAGAVHAQSAEVEKADPKTEARLKELAQELRCLVCQNQTIADSDAPLALDLRNQIRTQIAEGRSDDEIRGYMVQRYGDFVLYNPPFKATTAVLWVGPFALIVLGAGIFWVMVRRRRPREPAGVRPERRRDLESLLEDDQR